MNVSLTYFYAFAHRFHSYDRRRPEVFVPECRAVNMPSRCSSTVPACFRGMRMAYFGIRMAYFGMRMAYFDVSMTYDAGSPSGDVAHNPPCRDHGKHGPREHRRVYARIEPRSRLPFQLAVCKQYYYGNGGHEHEVVAGGCADVEMKQTVHGPLRPASGAFQTGEHQKRAPWKHPVRGRIVCEVYRRCQYQNCSGRQICGNLP